MALTLETGAGGPKFDSNIRIASEGRMKTTSDRSSVSPEDHPAFTHDDMDRFLLEGSNVLLSSYQNYAYKLM